MELEEVKGNMTEFDKLAKRVEKVVEDKYGGRISIGSAMYMMNELLDWRKENAKD